MKPRKKKARTFLKGIGGRADPRKCKGERGLGFNRMAALLNGEPEQPGLIKEEILN